MAFPEQLESGIAHFSPVRSDISPGRIAFFASLPGRRKPIGGGEPLPVLGNIDAFLLSEADDLTEEARLEIQGYFVDDLIIVGRRYMAHTPRPGIIPQKINRLVDYWLVGKEPDSRMKLAHALATSTPSFIDKGQILPWREVEHIYPKFLSIVVPFGDMAVMLMEYQDRKAPGGFINHIPIARVTRAMCVQIEDKLTERNLKKKSKDRKATSVELNDITLEIARETLVPLLYLGSDEIGKDVAYITLSTNIYSSMRKFPEFEDDRKRILEYGAALDNPDCRKRAIRFARGNS